jgi:uncharacterized membrane protein YfcA
MTSLIVLGVAALITSAISGILGMGGGILLLAVMFSVLTHAEAIPIHGAVQLVSNTTRVIAFLKHVHWRTVVRFSIGALPGGAVAGYLLWLLGEVGQSEPYLKMLVGAYILLTLILPKPKKLTKHGVWWDWPAMGLVAGTAAITVGAVGPLIAPMFARRDFVKESLVATKAVCQAILHVVKLPVFLAVAPFDYSRFGLMIAVMVAMVIPGTLIGKHLLTHHVSEQVFRRLFTVALLVAGIKVFVYDGLYPLLAD